MEDLDYSLVPEGGWNKLLIWYGLAEGSRPIARNVIEWGMYVKHPRVRNECSSGGIDEQFHIALIVNNRMFCPGSHLQLFNREEGIFEVHHKDCL